MANTGATTYHFVAIEHLVEQEIGKIVLPQIYERAGIKITIASLPGKRAEFEATSGLRNGEIMRIYSYGEENPTVRRVPTPYYYLQTMAFTKDGAGVSVRSREDLRSYTIAKVRGVKHTNVITEGLRKVSDVSNTVEIMRLLEQGLVDVGLTNTLDGVMTIQQLGLNDISPQGTPLATLNLYHYIHEEHQQLVAIIDEKIRQLRDSGELAIMIAEAENQVMLSYKLNAN
ncbi:ABC transporter substrate-binding protein [Planctobacterium marinum]|uniref:ABC transporter substrate-binding protein n=1 Tax=Planctobacterium marinum TaxID=1631968 RepID=A0AA48HL16_9ALTE|nr:ABC transporter substrate-binding protein [Planctobacterium marinum]